MDCVKEDCNNISRTSSLRQTVVTCRYDLLHLVTPPPPPPTSYPVLEVPAPIVQDVLELDDAVGHEVIVSYGRVVEDGQLDPAAVVHLGGELVVPGGAVGLLLGAGLAHPGVVHVQGDVGVQQEGLGALGAHGVTQGPRRGFELQSFADLDPQLPVEDHHGAGDRARRLMHELGGTTPTFPDRHKNH